MIPFFIALTSGAISLGSMYALIKQKRPETIYQKITVGLITAVVFFLTQNIILQPLLEHFNLIDSDKNPPKTRTHNKDSEDTVKPGE
ncbi:MAG: hypothetical protein WBA07_22405 [Rivularia sp. (in: cyanobacteria)]